MRTRFTACPRLEAMESRTLLSVTSPLPGATAIGPLHGPSAISAMNAVTLTGLTFAGSELSTKLTSGFFSGKQFTVKFAFADVTGGQILTQSTKTPIVVNGTLKFAVMKGSAMPPNKTDLNDLDSGTLTITPEKGNEITLTLSLPRNLSTSGGTYDYKVTDATGIYKMTTGRGRVTFSTLFPSTVLGDSTGNPVAGSLS